jgi:SNF2 family DNA or RNA helicase
LIKLINKCTPFLQDHDIVLTTYGTLQAEFNTEKFGPLLRAKWLRVCLDEGHFIKNHLAKTSKAACNLDTKRKWIISGTPIQNNLTELWALLFWLEEPKFGEDRPKFKHEIELPVKAGSMSGVVRLQVWLDLIFKESKSFSMVVRSTVGGLGDVL